MANPIMAIGTITVNSETSRTQCRTCRVPVLGARSGWKNTSPAAR